MSDVTASDRRPAAELGTPPLPTVAHVPTPGDHYSPATGSAPMTIIYELSREHARRGGQTLVVVARGTRHDYEVGEAVEVRLGSLPSRRQKAADAALGRLGWGRPFVESTYRPALDAVGPGFDGPVVVHNAAGPLRLFARCRPSARVCLYAHNSLFRTFGRREAARTVAAAHRVICDSHFLADELRARLRRPADNIAVVHNGVDTERFAPVPAPDDGPPVVLFVGRVIPEKGPDLLLRAAARIAADARSFRVRVVGSSGFAATDPLTPYERELRRLAAPIADCVEFQPFTDRASVVDEYRRASVFCVPSNWDEPCSLTLPEGLACGLPVVASARGGMPEIGGDAVLWFKPPDVEGLAEHLAYLLDDPQARADWGARARRQGERLSWGHQYERFARALC